MNEEFTSPNVFLDTCIIEGEMFNFASRRLAALSDLANANRVRTFTTPVTDYEIVERMRVAVAEEWRKLKGVLRYSNLPEIAAYRGLKATDIINELAQQHRAFHETLGTKVVEVPDHVLSVVLSDYAQRLSPFEASKKSEFPDAFALRALEAWCETNGQQMAVVSSDAGVRAACGRTDVLTPFASLADYLDAVNDADEVLVAFISEHVFEIDDPLQYVAQSFSGLGFGLADMSDGEVLEADLTDVEFDGDIEVIKLEADAASVQASAVLTFNATIEYMEPGTYWYDKEDGQIYGGNPVRDTVSRTVRRDIGLDVEFGDIDDGDFRVVSMWIADEADVFFESYPPSDPHYGWDIDLR